jgi:hypothetical protein
LESTQQQVLALARAIVTSLVKADLVDLKAGPPAAGRSAEDGAVGAVADEIARYLKDSAELQAEAERVAEEHLRGARSGRAGDLVGVDRHRMVQLIRQRLAAERNFPL